MKEILKKIIMKEKYMSVENISGQTAVSASTLPDTSSGGFGNDFLAILKGVGSGLIGTVASSAIGGAVSSAVGGLPSEYDSLLQLQRQMQLEQLTVTTISNVDRSRHESKMAAVRNIKG
jgi:hypothetical protein